MRKKVVDESGEDSALVRPRSALRIMGLLETLANATNGCRQVDLSRALDSPKTSLMRLLPQCVSDGYLVRSEGRYLIGPRMYRLAASMLSNRQFNRTARRFLEDLARLTEESAYLVVIDTEMKVATFIDMVPSRHSIHFTKRVGFVQPLYATAAGRVLLAHQSDGWIEKYLSEIEIKPLTSRTTLSKEDIRAELTRVRGNGVSVSIDEAVEGGGAVAAAILAPDGTIEAAFSVAAPTWRLRPKLAAIERAVTEVAMRASGLGRTQTIEGGVVAKSAVGSDPDL